MQDKKIVALIVLAILAVFSIIYGITAKPGARTADTAVFTPEKASPKEGALSVERRAKRSQFNSWKRSPFVSGGTSTSSNLVLSGIIWNKDRPKAMIGDAIVVKGSKIEGNTVVNIKPDRVILNDGTKDFELKLEK